MNTRGDENFDKKNAITRGKYSEGKNNGSSSHDKSDYNSMIAEPRLDDKPLSPVPPLLLSLKKIATRGMAEKSCVWVSKKSYTDNNKRVSSSACANKKKIFVPTKKRSYVEPGVERSNAAKKLCAVHEKSILKPKDPVEEAVCVLPIDDSRDKPKEVVMKSSKSTEELPVERNHDVKNHRQKVSSPQATHEVASTSHVVGTQLQDLPLNDQCSPSSEMCAVLNSESTNRPFKCETLKCNFKGFDYNTLLRDVQFTERQADVLQQSFHHISRKLFSVSNNSYRVMRTYNATQSILDQFIISHQCLTVDFSRSLHFSGNVTLRSSNIALELPIMCKCQQFGFFHAVSGFPNHKTVYSNVSLSCPRCNIYIYMRNFKYSDTACNEFTNWVSLEGDNSKLFYKYLKNDLQNSKVSTPPRLEELYVCSQQCCLLFHRCAVEAIND